MLALDNARTFGVPSNVKTHLDTEKFVQLSHYGSCKVGTSVGADFFWASTKSAVQSDEGFGGVYCSVPVTWDGNEESGKRVDYGQNVLMTETGRGGHMDEVDVQDFERVLALDVCTSQLLPSAIVDTFSS